MGVPSDHQAYLNLLRDLSGKLDQLGGLAEQKAQTVRQDDLLAMDEVLKQEQVLSLALRGLEQRRTKLLAKLGLSDVALKDLPSHYPEELADEAIPFSEVVTALTMLEISGYVEALPGGAYRVI